MSVSASPLFARTTSTGDASRPELDALRGIAVLGVVFQHYADPHRGSLDAALNELPSAIAPWVQAAVAHARVGVDLFFVLSGLTLSLAWLRARDRGVVPRPAQFFLRRAARLVPAYVVVLALVLVLEPWQLRGESPSVIALALFTHLTFLQGYVIVGSIVLIGASWSLTTEVCFYALFPWLAPTVLGADRRNAIVMALGLAFAAWAMKAILHDYAVARGQWGLLDMSQWRLIVTRLDEFVLGMLVAMLVRSDRIAAPRTTTALLAAAALLFAVGARAESAAYGRPGGGLPYVLVSVSVTLFVYAIATASPRVRHAFAVRPLAFIGIVSYGVFLSHQLVERFIRVVIPCRPGEAALTHALVMGGVSLALSIAFGAVSFVLVERPMLARVARS